jgi:hypothetical protein
MKFPFENIAQITEITSGGKQYVAAAIEEKTWVIDCKTVGTNSLYNKFWEF